MTFTLPDSETGISRFDPTGFTVGADVSEGECLHSRIAPAHAIIVANPPHITYRLVDPYDLDGQPFVVSLSFSAGRLRSMSLAIASPPGTSWSDWSEVHERKKQRLHDDLLRSVYGGTPPYNFGWGTISSQYDPRSGGSSITINYASAARK